MKRVSLKIAGGTFEPRLIPSLITLCIVAGTLVLAFWQLDRLKWKTALILEMNARMQEPELDVGLSQILPETVAGLDYHPGKATGLFENDKSLYLNATRLGSGAGGYHLLTAFKLDDGHTLLVDRGWIPYALKEGHDPNAGTLYSPQKEVQVTGILRLPFDKKPPMRPENDLAKNVWYWIDLSAMAKASGVKEFEPFILEADDAPHDGSYPIGGQTKVDLPNHHFQYALTWFWLSFILPVIYLASSWRLSPRKDKKAAGETPKTS